MKIVVNKCYGGFGLSPRATKMAVELGLPCKPYPYEPGHGMNKGDAELEQLGDGWVVMGPPKSSSFKRVIKDGQVYYLSDSSIEFRSHPALVQTVEQMGKEANGACANLEVVEVPDDVAVQIEEYDGFEHIAEQHRTW